MTPANPPIPSAAAALVRELQRVHALHAARASNPILAGALERLGDWQARRLAATYADLARDARYADAIAFFPVGSKRRAIIARSKGVRSLRRKLLRSRS